MAPAGCGLDCRAPAGYLRHARAVGIGDDTRRCASREVLVLEEVDLTPSPRLLEVLGDIPYKPWQCLAELIDNSFDDFLGDPDRDPGDPPEVRDTLPKPMTAAAEDALVCVADNGRGMSLGELENALKAGYSSNAWYG